MLLNKILILLFILFFVFAATKPPMIIESETLVIEGLKNSVIFKGNVSATNDGSKINSDIMTVFYDKDKKPQRVECEGNVKFSREDMYGLSKRAEMDLNNNIIKLIGDVKVWQGENYLEGEEVIIYNDSERIEIKQKEGKRVKIIFTPENKDNLIGNNSKKPEKNIQ